MIVEDDWTTLPTGAAVSMALEKADELQMPVTLHAAANDLAFPHVQRGEQPTGAVVPIIWARLAVHHSISAAHVQYRLIADLPMV